MGYREELELIESDLETGMARGKVYALPAPAQGPSCSAPYAHQLMALSRIDQGSAQHVSGIVHLPTGAGKTRVALEFIARTLRADPQHRFLWATQAKLLIQQTMVRAFQLASIFPPGVRMARYEGEPDFLENEDVHLMFLTQVHLRQEIECAHDARSSHPWRAWLEAGRPLTLIYDECHQLGGRELQKELRKFYEKVVATGSRRRRPWRVVGLSATPVPTNPDAHSLLQKHVFPLRDTPPSAAKDWGMHVFHRASNADLRREGILCDVNAFFDQQGTFDIPPDLLRKAGESRIRPPGANASRQDVLEYAKSFNHSVMGHPQVLRFLADRLAQNLNALGKTIVFVPDIEAANRLVALLLESDRSMRGRVAAVHSRMRDLAVPGQTARTPEEVLKAFTDRGAAPCILVNVEMLTEGFDDPLVRTVVLAKLTLSSNRFWQMIGRGTRGVRAGGTTDCFVIDPIKLVRLYDYFAGYQPAIGKAPGTAIDDAPEEGGPGALDPSVPAVSRPPLPSATPYKVHRQFAREAPAVALAIEAFLRGDSLGEDDALAIANRAEARAEQGTLVLSPTEEQFHPGTAQMLILEELHRAAGRLGCDLSWMERQVATVSDPEVLRFWIRKLAAVERLAIRTEAQYVRAEMDGSLGRELAAATPTRPSHIPEPPSAVVLEGLAASVVELCAALARADGELRDAEVEAMARVLVRVCGTPDRPELRTVARTAAAGARTFPQALADVQGRVDDGSRKLLLRELVALAAADDFVAPDERALLEQAAEGLGVHRDYLEGILDLMAG